MRALTKNQDRSFHVVSLQTLEPLPPPFGGEVFPCLVWDHHGGWPREARVEFARTLIHGGCRYAVCAGNEAEQWHLAFDLAFVQDHGDEPEDSWAGKFVMTTEHGGETPDEVAFFFVLNTNFEEHDFKNYLLLHLGTGSQAPAIEEAVKTYAKPAAA